MIKNIVFDFGGVLVDWDPRYFYRTVFADRRIYDTLLQRYSLRAEECLFIDDNPGNAEAVRIAGMHAVCFTDADTLRGDLDTLGLL